MFSYRHSFHAGNHGDVLKHLCQMAIIEKLKEKDKGFSYIDTHSGAGVYQLNSNDSLKTKEFQSGIASLMKYSGSDQIIRRYLSLVTNYYDFKQYPGSPEIARTMLRPQDQGIVMEWNNAEIENLKANINSKQIAIHHRDGFEGLIALTPPDKKRGLVLIDPPYESAEEYQQVIDTVVAAYKRWPTAIYAIWYPLIQTRKQTSDTFNSAEPKQGKSEKMLAKLQQQKFKNLLRVELKLATAEQAEGMYGSGLAIINAPWQLDINIASSLQELISVMTENAGASSEVEWLIKPD
ncbi:23S rRNA (adenine(2030)-N(6))-methyltransferase RlmJ [Paraglaciecola aquimarina]|uniref:Ribosomal RNA large subunit methyltransferase J n=1 Tax=Paraglaciecola algarum TaxID=3050085 RepID=A0ABS9D324_9ALTE|nr:23S rRNA (adenine(2030)-N(6))-methyltransferase RlmJ [Paraglaciecola sp. G1-23]MCF2947014.1 23S rRNA (adenine(2030)-N(6))-methyltransferase RlmJ [Paraglaciecola sp. G1-23]